MSFVICSGCASEVPPETLEECEHCGRTICVACKLLDHDDGECVDGEDSEGFEDEGGEG